MAEKLCELKKKGGGASSFNLMHPDAEYTNGSMSNNATANISVSQMPSYILFFIDVSSGNSLSLYGICDVQNSTAMRAGYYGGAIRSWTSWSDYSNYITSITSSTVSIKNSSGTTCRVVVEVYY